MLKILQPRLQQYMKRDLPHVQAGFRKGRGNRSNCHHHWIIEKAREFQKNICFIYYTKAFDCVDHNKLWESLQEMGISAYRFLRRQVRWSVTTLPAFWEICMQVKKQQLEPDMEQWTGSKLGKEYTQAVSCHPAYLTYMQSTSWEMLGWRKHKLESRFSSVQSLSHVPLFATS